MKKGMVVLFAALFTVLALAGPIDDTIGVNSHPCVGQGCIVVTKPLLPSLHDTMREVWTDHAVWSRMMVMGVLEPMKACEFYEDRLNRSVKDLTALLTPYYGDGAQKFGNLLREHNELEDQLLYAMKSDDQVFRSVLKDWYLNAEDMAVLLNQLNPKYWRRDEISQIWRMHLDTSLDQAFAYSKGDWQYDIQSFDSLQDQGSRMADYLSDGILKQFGKQR